jgi:hypothetical protein
MSDTNQKLTKLSAAAAKGLGIPPDVQFFSPWPFAGMNQQDARTALQDQEFFWIENLFLTGNASLRSLWDIGTALYTAPVGKTIVYFAWYNLGTTYYVSVFLSDGTAVQVQQTNGAVTTISATPGTFYTGGQLPFAVQSGAQYLLICNNITPNAYWIWDGAILYGTGTIGPYQIGAITDSGTGYSSAPSVTPFGGTGTGVTAIATVTNGSVVSLQITNPGTGYSPGDIVQFAFSGGGSDNSAILQATLTAGAITNVELIFGGTGYVTAPTVSFSGGGGGTGATAVATIAGGAVTGITVTAGGSGYTATPTVGISGGSGSGASAVAVINATSVAAISVINGGTGFASTPALSFEGGGGGSGAIATATIAGGSITSVAVTNGGTGYQTAPTVVVAPGSNDAASAQIDVMPFGISGTCIETFLSRIWISAPAPNGTPQTASTFNVSAPESLTDFSSADGGLLYSSSDRFLRAGYTALHQSNGYLYPIGDSSVDVISNVQTGGSPTATNFNYQNTSAQVGSVWRDTIQDFGQSVLFANSNGIQGLYGGAIRRVSAKVNNIFDSAFPRDPTTGQVSILPGGLTPSGAVMNLHTIPVYLLLLSGIDPNTQAQRNFMLMWDEKNWYVASQSAALTFIGTQVQNSVMTAWGTDGAKLYPLLSLPSSALTKSIYTKLYGGERELIQYNTADIYFRATDKSSGQAGVSMTAVLEGAGFNTQVGAYPTPPTANVAAIPIQPNFNAPEGTAPSWGAQASNVPGTAIGAMITSMSPDFVLSGITIAYKQLAIGYG